MTRGDGVRLPTAMRRSRRGCPTLTRLAVVPTLHDDQAGAEAGDSGLTNGGPLRHLGPHGVNLVEFCRRYNDATRGQEGRIFPAKVTIYEDRSFDLRLKTPLTSALLREAAGIEKGAASPNGKPVGTVTREQLRRIAETKMPDLNAGSIEAAMKVVEGTARTMGIRVNA
jgi:large subunit ribosomal protein L11